MRPELAFRRSAENRFSRAVHGSATRPSGGPKGASDGSNSRIDSPPTWPWPVQHCVITAPRCHRAAAALLLPRCRRAALAPPSQREHRESTLPWRASRLA